MIFHNGSSSTYAMHGSQLCVCDSRHNPNIRTRPTEPLHTQPSCPSAASCSPSCRSCCSREIQIGKVVETNLYSQHVGIQMELHSPPMEKLHQSISSLKCQMKLNLCSVTELVRIYAKRPYTAFCGRTGTYLVPIFPKSP